MGASTRPRYRRMLKLTLGIAEAAVGIFRQYVLNETPE